MQTDGTNTAKLLMARAPGHRLRLWTYVLAVAVTAAALGLRLSCSPWFGDRPVLVLFVLPIMLSAYIGGLGPGLVATVGAGVVTSYFLVPPVMSFAMERPVDMVQWLILILIGVVISLLTESLHRARLRDPGSVAIDTSSSTERKVRTAFGLALACLAVVSALAVYSVTRQREASRWATHTEEVISSLRLLLSTITDVETAERGYLIAGDQRYLEPYNKARSTIDGRLDGLRKLTADNTGQQRQLDLLQPLITECLRAAEESIARRSQEFDPAAATILTDHGRQLHDRIRELIAGMELTEQGLLQEREKNAQHISAVTRTVIISGGTLSLVLVAAALFILSQEFTVRHRAEAALQQARDQLEVRVRERTAELEQTNRALRESDELFSTAFQSSPDCLVIVRLPDRTVIRANEAVCRLWGSTPEQIIGRPTRDYTTWLTEDERLSFMRTLQETGECLNYDTTLRLQDGRLVEFNLSSRLITIHGESCVLSVMRDITDRKQAEVVQRRLVAIVNSTDDAIISKTLEGVITSWNPGAEKIFGYSTAEAMGRSMLMIFPPDRAAEEKDILARIARGESVRHFETERVRKDGRRIEVSVALSPIIDYNGKIIGASKIARDITEHKQAEEAQARLAAIVREMDEAFLTLDAEWRFTFVNDRCEKLVRHRREEMLGRSFWEVFSKLVGTPMEKVIRRAMADRAPVSFEAFSPVAERWLDIRLFPSGDGLTSFLMDINERKLAEQELQKTSAELQLMLKNMLNAFIVWESVFDASGKYVSFRFGYFNDAYMRIAGVTAAEVKGKDVFAVWPTTEQSWVEVYGSVAVTGVPRVFDMYHAPTKGWYHCNAYRPTDSPAQVCVIFEDITERKQAEAKLNEQLDELRRWHKAMLGREERTQELKREVNQLCQQLGQPARYPTEDLPAAAAASQLPK